MGQGIPAEDETGVGGVIQVFLVVVAMVCDSRLRHR